VFLSWAIPGCSDACPSSWINDGYCDKACNNTECDWDGGDCSGEKGRQPAADFAFGDLADSESHCSRGCANSWVADKYCDGVCSTYECAFDAGDCGDKSFHHMFRVAVTNNDSSYELPS
ncbi:PREDICTED: N-acetylglucosamine-1-phosphotransferase subunits alpha/beta-like, partial [Priapulus caudatus]|uniref:N-acetylglucosamine-1-phosphotransferase subunits alpha/beta-like n=1 Tax=Priapulus caudatus TaxID=37621 RepID=A0ABM1F605_PRICU